VEHAATPAPVDTGKGARIEKLVVVEMKTALERYTKTKDAEQRIAEAGATAKKDLETRTAACKAMGADLEKLNGELQNTSLSAPEKVAKSKQRDEKAAEYKQAVNTLVEFQQARRRQLEEQTARVRGGLLHDIEKAVTDITHDMTPDLVIDASALGSKGLPAVVAAKRLCNITGEVIARVNAAAVPERKPLSAPPAIACADFNRIFNSLPEVREINAAEAKLLSTAGTDPNARIAAQETASQKKAPQVTRVLEAIQAVGDTQQVDLVFNSGERSIDGLEFLVRHDGLPDLTGRVLAKLGLPPQ